MLKNLTGILTILLTVSSYNLFGQIWFVTTSADDGSYDSLRSVMSRAQNGDGIMLAIKDPIMLAQGQLTVDKNITINGNNITIDANKKSRVMEIAPSANVEILNLKFTNGYVSGDNASGGGILNNGKLTLTNCEISGNSCESSDAHGGGICAVGYSPDTPASIKFLLPGRTSIKNNSVTGSNADAGGLYIDGHGFTTASGLENVDFANNTPDNINPPYDIWEAYGGVGFSKIGVAYTSTVADNIDKDNDVIYMAYVDQNGNVNVERNKSGQWEQLYYKTDGNAANTQLAFDKENQLLYLAYIDTPSVGYVLQCDLKKNAKTWIDLKAPGGDKIVTGSNGVLYAFLEKDIRTLAVYSHFPNDGNRWTQIGSDITLPATEIVKDWTNLSLVISPDNTVYISFVSMVNNEFHYHLNNMKYDTSLSKWENLGDPWDFSAMNSDFETIAVSNDNIPYVAFNDDNGITIGLSIKKYISGEWQYEGAPRFGKCSIDPGMASIIFTQDGTLYVSYCGFKPGYDLHTYRYVNNNWEDISLLYGYQLLTYNGSYSGLTVTGTGHIYMGMMDGSAASGAATVFRFIK